MKNRKNTSGTAGFFPGCPKEADITTNTIAGNRYPFNFTEIYAGKTVFAGPAQQGESVTPLPGRPPCVERISLIY